MRWRELFGLTLFYHGDDGLMRRTTAYRVARARAMELQFESTSCYGGAQDGQVQGERPRSRHCSLSSRRHDLWVVFLIVHVMMESCNELLRNNDSYLIGNNVVYKKCLGQYGQ